MIVIGLSAHRKDCSTFSLIHVALVSLLGGRKSGDGGGGGGRGSDVKGDYFGALS